MNLLYCTADQINAQSGGGAVTFHESKALKELGPCEVWGREQFALVKQVDVDAPNEMMLVRWFDEPWFWDTVASVQLPRSDYARMGYAADYRLAHFYAGTFSHTVRELRKRGCKVTYTAAAHDVALSRQEHEQLGVPYNYPHLTDPSLWKRYLQGYLDADVLICPSQHSANVMRGFGAKNRIEIIPHGVELPICRNCSGEGDHPVVIRPGVYAEDIARNCEVCHGTGNAPPTPLPQQFRIGYLGAYGPDKGVVYLLKAWAELNYSDALLVLGGRDSNSPWVHALLQHTGAKNVVMTGWVDNVNDFYSQVSLYVQPSITEGFGIEVLEAFAHGRLVLCSTGVGAVDAVPKWLHFPAGDVTSLAGLIDHYKKNPDVLHRRTKFARKFAELYTWASIRQQYQAVWKELLA